MSETLCNAGQREAAAPRITLWRGVNIRDLTREELIEALEQAGIQLQEAHASFQSFAGFHRLVVSGIRSHR